MHGGVAVTRTKLELSAFDDIFFKRGESSGGRRKRSESPEKMEMKMTERINRELQSGSPGP